MTTNATEAVVWLFWHDDPEELIQGYVIEISTEEDKHEDDTDVFYHVRDLEELEGLGKSDNGGDFTLLKIDDEFTESWKDWAAKYDEDGYYTD